MILNYLSHFLQTTDFLNLTNKRDTMVLTKTRFKKSLLFQKLFFIKKNIIVPAIVLILILIKN